MALNTWAAFVGTEENAAIAGDVAMLETELTPVLKTLRKNGIDVVAIHHHMTEERPLVIFLHYWGQGPADKLASAFKATLVDFRVNGTKPFAEEMLSNTFHVGNLAASQREFVAYWPLSMPIKKHYAFNFFFTARNGNGFVAQQIRFVKIGDKWLSATEVTPFSGRRILYRHIDAGFPRNPHGKIDWNDEVYTSGD